MICGRPGCGKPVPPEKVRWCSRTCSVIAAHVRAWKRAAGEVEVTEERIRDALHARHLEQKIAPGYRKLYDDDCDIVARDLARRLT